MVIEHAEFGNLREFLRDRRPLTSDCNESSTKDDSIYGRPSLTGEAAINMVDLISFCFQIARGMEYLESRKVSSRK